MGFPLLPFLLSDTHRFFDRFKTPIDLKDTVDRECHIFYGCLRLLTENAFLWVSYSRHPQIEGYC